MVDVASTASAAANDFMSSCLRAMTGVKCLELCVEVCGYLSCGGKVVGGLRDREVKWALS